MRSRVQQAVKQAMQLPEPGNEALLHSQRLQQVIARHIEQQGGSIPFRDYMHMALYEPGLGYYSAGSRKLGADGDFITAPEISVLFSQCLANAIMPILQQDKQFSILEVGAGRGVMARDILQYLQQQQSLPQNYFILEVSADLRQRQQQILSELDKVLFQRVVWLDALPQHFRGVVLANELLDALPVTLFCKQQGSVHELDVAIQDNQFVLQSNTSNNERLQQRIHDIEHELQQLLPDNYFSEVNFTAEDWITSIAEHVTEAVVLLIDYGHARQEYYHAQRQQGTLLCHYRHRAHADPFLYPGLQDITAHVDFSAMAQAAYQAGFEVAGYTTQASFLLSSGLLELSQQSDDAAQQLQLATQMRKLTLPQEMGETFKVLALRKGELPMCKGFELRDMRYQL